MSEGRLVIWLDDEGYKLQQAVRQLHVGYLHKLRTSKKILIFLLIITSLKNAVNVKFGEVLGIL